MVSRYIDKLNNTSKRLTNYGIGLIVSGTFYLVLCYVGF